MVDQRYTVKAEHFDDGFVIGDGYLRLHRHGSPMTGFYWTGDFFDPRGMVSVYRQSGVTRLDFAFAGRAHVRTWREYFGDRTISRLCRAFITDVTTPGGGT